MDRGEALLKAIIERAVMDWRLLCKGQKPTGDCNFEELERFFTEELPENYQFNSDIYQRLLEERYEGEQNAANR